MSTKTKKRRLAVLLSIVLLLSQTSFASNEFSAPSQQSNNSPVTSQPEPGRFEPNVETNSNAPTVLPPVEQSDAARAYLQNNEEVFGQIINLASELEDKKNELLKERGEQFVSNMIAGANLIYKEPGVGKADYRIIKGDKGAPDTVITRVVLDKTEKAYLLINQNQMPTGFYFRKYLAGLLIEAGYRPQRDASGHAQTNIFGRPKMRYGRNTDVLVFNDNILADAHLRKKPTPANWNWWREYFWSKYDRPTKATLTAGFVFGALPHTIVNAAMAHLLHVSYWSAGWNFAYSMFIGAYISTYKAWTNSGERPSVRVLKLMANAMVYATVLVMMMKPGSMHQKLAAVSFVSLASILANVAMNSVARNKWNQISKIGDEARANSGLWTIPFTNIKTWWKRSHVNNQLLYLIPWTINLVGIFILGATKMFQVPHTGITVPVLQFAGMPIAMIWSALYARSIARRAKYDPALLEHYKDLNKMALQYERDVNRWVPLHLQIGANMAVRSAWHKVRPTARAVGRVTRRAVRRCADILTN